MFPVYGLNGMNGPQLFVEAVNYTTAKILKSNYKVNGELMLVFII